MDRSHLPDRAEAAAVELLSLAAAIDAHGPASSRALVRVADLLLWTPQTHPLRSVPEERVDEEGRPVTCSADLVVRMSTRIRRGVVQPEELRGFAAELRAGREAMFERGWGWLLRGGVE